jgi:hypothetical protein
MYVVKFIPFSLQQLPGQATAISGPLRLDYETQTRMSLASSTDIFLGKEMRRAAAVMRQ